MEFGKSFTYIFEEEDWIVKILLAAVIALIPLIGPFAIMGWAVEITKRVIHDEVEKLPDWGGFVDFLIKGLVATLIAFVYMLPIIILQSCVVFLPMLAQEGSSDAVQAIAAIIGLCIGLFMLIYIILASFLIMAGIGTYADTGDLSAAFRIGKSFQIVKAAPVAYFMVFLGTILAGFIASLGTILCVIGVFFTAVLAQAIIAHLQGQAYREAKLNMGNAVAEF